MKALSIRQPWASMITSGKKTIETRLWKTDYRGNLLIVAGRQWAEGFLSDLSLPIGQGIAVVRLTDCSPMTEADEKAACCKVYDGAFAWVFEDVRLIQPFPVKGQLGLFEVSAHPHICYPAD